MALSLKLMNSGTLPGGQSRVVMVDGALTIGRGEENDLALPDPDRTLSKRHCVLEERNGDYVLIDISTNGTFLNYGAERLGTIPTPLNDGDVIQIGSYELVVAMDAGRPDPQHAAPLPPAPETDVMAGYQRSNTAGGDINDALDELDAPWDEILGDNASDPFAAPSQPKRGAYGAQGAGRWPEPQFDQPPPPPRHGHQQIPGDPFDMPVAPDDPLAGDPLGNPPLAGDPLAGAPFSGGVIPEDFSLDDLPPPASEGESVADHHPSAQDYFSSPLVERSLIPDDWDDLDAPEVATPVPPAPPPPPQAARPDNLQPAPPVPPQAPSPSQAPVTSTPQGIDAAHAFLKGAGMDHLSIPPQELPQTMERMGRVFAAMVAGMREVLMTRASIKSEMRMERTMINQGGNNPLKFSISPEQAVEAMIRPSVRGYQDAETATTEALNDIKAHEVAMVSGMEAALKDLLARLGPDQLSQRIESGSTLGGLLGGKKAKYWEAYEKMYAQIARETEDDFQSTFGREFARAYEEQLKKL